MLSKRNNRKNRSTRKSGAGYLSPAEFFNPEARQPSSSAPAITSQPSPGWVRPPMTATTFMSPNVKAGGRRLRRNRKSGAGYLSPAEFFNPEARQPSSSAPAITSQPSPGWVRPPMTATTFMSPNVKSGGRRNTRRNNRKNKRNTMKGGFVPAIMGSFVSNTQSVIVPLVLAGLYSLVGPKQTAKAVSAHTKTK